VDEVFKALADESRRQLLDRLNAQSGQTLRELCAGLDMARQSVSKHLAVLEAANLVTTAWRGREKLHYLNPEPINAIADRWISRYDRARVHALADLKTALEETSMADTAFVYTTYIRSSPKRVWQALTEPAFQSRYWGATFDSDLTVGSPVTWHWGGVTMADPEQVIVESDPYRRLAFTWHSFTPEWAAAAGVDGDLLARYNADSRSTATFDIEETDDGVKLTVTHDGFQPGSPVLENIGGGWPRVLSNLKSLLETGS
jgi:uncharacterized protein YndB with AHSA1/START domain